MSDPIITQNGRPVGVQPPPFLAGRGAWRKLAEQPVAAPDLPATWTPKATVPLAAVDLATWPESLRPRELPPMLDADEAPYFDQAHAAVTRSRPAPVADELADDLPVVDSAPVADEHDRRIWISVAIVLAVAVAVVLVLRLFHVGEPPKPRHLAPPSALASMAPAVDQDLQGDISVPVEPINTDTPTPVRPSPTVAIAVAPPLPTPTNSLAPSFDAENVPPAPQPPAPLPGDGVPLGGGAPAGPVGGSWPADQPGEQPAPAAALAVATPAPAPPPSNSAAADMPGYVAPTKPGIYPYGPNVATGCTGVPFMLNRAPCSP